jgi:HSP20 family protein
MPKGGTTMTSRLSTLATPHFLTRNGLASMQGQMDQLFDRLFNGGDAQPDAGWGFAPLSIFEDAERVRVDIDLPGISKEDIQVTVVPGELQVMAERKAAQAEQGPMYNERRYGKTQRAIRLPDAIDPDSTHAELHDGVLSVTLSKRPEAQPKRISIMANQAP